VVVWLVLLFLRDRISLWSRPSWPGIHCVAQAGLKPSPPASASGMCHTPGSMSFILGTLSYASWC
jgi:hypothetical protein